MKEHPTIQCPLRFGMDIERYNYDCMGYACAWFFEPSSTCALYEIAISTYEPIRELLEREEEQ